MKGKQPYKVSEGKQVLHLEPAVECGYIGTSPLDGKLITEAETIEAAFVSANDAATALRQSRLKLLRKLQDQLAHS